MPTEFKDPVKGNAVMSNVFSVMGKHEEDYWQAEEFCMFTDFLQDSLVCSMLSHLSFAVGKAYIHIHIQQS